MGWGPPQCWWGLGGQGGLGVRGGVGTWQVLGNLGHLREGRGPTFVVNRVAGEVKATQGRARVVAQRSCQLQSKVPVQVGAGRHPDPPNALQPPTIGLRAPGAESGLHDALNPHLGADVWAQSPPKLDLPSPGLGVSVCVAGGSHSRF